MKKLYYDNQYIKDFSTELVEVIEKEGKFHVVLEETAFYPGGGGQPCDIGRLEGDSVIEVYEEAGKIYHVMEKRPIKIHKIKGKIDWSRRMDHMVHHLAQHIISACFRKEYGKETFGFHLGKEICTVDIDGSIDDSMLEEIEKEVNEIIFENIRVELIEATKSDLKKYFSRKEIPKTSEPLRLVIV